MVCVPIKIEGESVPEIIQNDDCRLQIDTISTHTFLFPFTFKDDDQQHTLHNIIERLTHGADAVWHEGIGHAMLEEDCYMTAQYFNRQAASIFGLLPEKIAPSGRA